MLKSKTTDFQNGFAANVTVGKTKKGLLQLYRYKSSVTAQYDPKKCSLKQNTHLSHMDNARKLMFAAKTNLKNC